MRFRSALDARRILGRSSRYSPVRLVIVLYVVNGSGRRMRRPDKPATPPHPKRYVPTSEAAHL